jgi:hypothetical protein
MTLISFENITNYPQPASPQPIDNIDSDDESDDDLPPPLVLRRTDATNNMAQQPVTYTNKMLYLLWTSIEPISASQFRIAQFLR